MDVFVYLGWNGNNLYFSDSNSHLPQLTLDGNNPDETHSKHEIVCLPAGTYTPFACGGSYSYEVWWEVHVNEVSGGATETCSGPPAGAESFTVGVETGYSSRLFYLRGDTTQKLSVTVKNATIRHFGYSESFVWGGALYAVNLTDLTLQSVMVPPTFLHTILHTSICMQIHTSLRLTSTPCFFCSPGII